MSQNKFTDASKSDSPSQRRYSYLAVDTLTQLLTCDANTGELRWSVRPRRFFPSDWAFKVWNKRYANMKTGTTPGPNGLYGTLGIFDKTYLAHRVVWALHYGKWPDAEIDHINGNGWDNRIQNLRAVTSSENSMNTKIHAHNTSGYMGVYFEACTQRWVASVERDRVRHKKRFRTKEEAIAYRQQKEVEWGYHPNHGRR